MTPGGRPLFRMTLQWWSLAAEARRRILRREVRWWVFMRARWREGIVWGRGWMGRWGRWGSGGGKVGEVGRW